MKSCISSKAVVALSFVLCVWHPAFSQNFDAFLARVNSVPDSLRTTVADSFMAATKSFPVIEQDSIVHFIYRGAANGVTVPGDANDWQPAASPMTNITGTNMWYLTQTYPPDARLEYKYVINNTTWILDPQNPNQIVEGFGPNSELRMPEYVSPPEIKYDASIPHGVTKDTTLYSPELSNSRKITVYLPPGYSSSSDSFPVVYFQDGTETISLENAENVIDYLTAHGLIQPIIAVFVPYVNRTPEYAGNQVDSFMTFYVREIVPYVDSTFRTVKNAGGRAVIGASYGGNISLWLGSTYPNIFGNIGAQSSYVDPLISTRFQNGSKLDLEIYMDLGTFDIPSLIPLVHSFLQIIKDRGYNFQYHEYDEGHSWGNWRAHLRNALIFFFPPKPTGLNDVSPTSSGYMLGQNFPNPFNPSTLITYHIASAGNVTLKVYDVLGREITTLIDGRQPAGDHYAKFNASQLAAGVYLYRLSASGCSSVRKMVVLK